MQIKTFRITCNDNNVVLDDYTISLALEKHFNAKFQIDEIDIENESYKQGYEDGYYDGLNNSNNYLEYKKREKEVQKKVKKFLDKNPNATMRQILQLREDLDD